MDNGQPGVGTGAPQPTNNGQPFNPASNSQPAQQASSGYTPNPYGDPNGGGFTTPPHTGDIVLQPDTKQKKRKGLIIGLVCLFLVLIGGGAFAAAYIISNQPNNIALSAFDRLMNADQVQVDGSFSASFNNNNLLGIKSFNVKFDETTANSNHSATISAEVALAGASKTLSLDLGEAMLSNGVFYLKADGLKTIYYDTFSDEIRDYIYSGLLSSYQSSTLSQCYDGIEDDGAAYQACLDAYAADVTPEVQTALEDATSAVIAEIGGIVDVVDGQWIEFSIDDILNSDLLSLDSATKQSVSQAYNCTTDKLTHFSQYSGEFSDLYGQNPFLVMTAGQDSFYDISLDAASLAGYLNAVPQTQLVKDLAACTDTTAEVDSSSELTTEDIQSSIDYLPQISAKFDSSLFSHTLSELKINEANENYTLNSDLKFTYPTDATVSAPSDTRPVMELVAEVYDRINSLQWTFYTFQ